MCVMGEEQPNRFSRRSLKFALQLLVSLVVGLLTMLMRSDANNFINSKSHARENPLLASYLHTVVVYVFSEHRV